MYLFQLSSMTVHSISHCHLHSTMYLFQLNDNYMFYLRKGIYIPLCIYFNETSTFLVTFLTLFTFHYVSISTFVLVNIFVK